MTAKQPFNHIDLPCGQILTADLRNQDDQREISISVVIPKPTNEQDPETLSLIVRDRFRQRQIEFDYDLGEAVSVRVSCDENVPLGGFLHVFTD